MTTWFHYWPESGFGNREKEKGRDVEKLVEYFLTRNILKAIESERLSVICIGGMREEMKNVRVRDSLIVSYRTRRFFNSNTKPSVGD